MPEKEPNINRKDLKSEGKLTPDEAKAMVQKFKKEHEGLLPEYFSLPGEENEEKEREYPEELLDYYQLKEQLKPIEEKLKDDTLRRNMIDSIIYRITYGQKSGRSDSAECAFRDYISFLSYPEFKEIEIKHPRKINEIKKELRNQTIAKNIIDGIMNYITECQNEINTGKDHIFTWSSTNAFRFYSYLFSYPEFDVIKAGHQREINQIEEGLGDERIRENTVNGIIFKIQKYQETGDVDDAWSIFIAYSSLLSYPKFNEIKEKYLIKINKIEEELKDENLRKSMIDTILKNVLSGKKKGEIESAESAFINYFYFLSYLNHLYKVGQKKLAEIESQKAMHPELRKNLPPIPEERIF